MPLPIDEFFKIEPERWKSIDVWVIDLETFIRQEAPHYRSVDPRAVVWVPLGDITGAVVDDGIVFASAGAVRAAREAKLLFTVVGEPVSAAELPRDCQLRIGLPQVDAMPVARQLAAGAVSSTEVTVPELVDRVERQPFRPETYHRIELFTTLVQDSVLLLASAVVRVVMLAALHLLVPSPSSDWVLRAMELLLDVGLTGTVLIHVTFDLAKRVKNAWYYFRGPPS